jgi:hypothetical protein
MYLMLIIDQAKINTICETSRLPIWRNQVRRKLLGMLRTQKRRSSHHLHGRGRAHETRRFRNMNPIVCEAMNGSDVQARQHRTSHGRFRTDEGSEVLYVNIVASCGECGKRSYAHERVPGTMIDGRSHVHGCVRVQNVPSVSVRYCLGARGLMNKQLNTRIMNIRN